MEFPDKIVIFSPNENISSQDANLLSQFLYQTHKTFIDNYVSEFSCRVAGLIPSFTNNHTASPLINLSTPGVAVFNLNTDPNSYSGGSFFLQSFSAIGITPPVSGTRTDSLDIIYQELEGASGGVGSFDLRDEINNSGIITPNQPFHTQQWTSCSVVYVSNSPGVNGGNPQPGAVRLCTFTVTSAGDCALTFTLPSIWENQAWPSVNSVPPNNANASNTLFDHLSAIRYQLNAIIGKVNWYDSPVLSLLQLGDAPQFWGGTATGAVNQLNLTIPNFPINANIINGTRVVMFVNNTNTGSVNVSVNGQANISLRDSQGNLLSGGELSATGMYEFIYTGTTFNLLGNPVVDNDLVGTQVQNGSFESWTGAVPTTWSVTTTQFASISREFNAPGSNQGSAHGGNALRVNTGTGGIGGGGGSASVTSSLIPISDVATYFIKFKTYATSNTLPINVTVNFFDYAGNPLGSPVTIWTASVSTPTSWKTFYGFVKPQLNTQAFQGGHNKVSPHALSPLSPIIPNNSRYMTVTVSAGANGGASNQMAWFDDVEIFNPSYSNEQVVIPLSGTWVFLTGPNSVEAIITLVGAGGAGGNQPSGDSFNHGGGGGGAGGLVRMRVGVNPETRYFIQIGQGGTSTSGNGNPGGTTLMLLDDNVTPLFRVFGGSGGQHISGGSGPNPIFDTPGFTGFQFSGSVDGMDVLMSVQGNSGSNLGNTNPNQNGGNGGSTISNFNPSFFGAGGAGAGGNNAGSPGAVNGQYGGGGGGAATGPFNFFAANGGDGVAIIQI